MCCSLKQAIGVFLKERASLLEYGQNYGSVKFLVQALGQVQPQLDLHRHLFIDVDAKERGGERDGETKEERDKGIERQKK